jgi:hypothetical protein
MAAMAQIFRDSELLVDARILKNNTDPAPDGVGSGFHVGTKYGCLARRGRERG